MQVGFASFGTACAPCRGLGVVQHRTSQSTVVLFPLGVLALALTGFVVGVLLTPLGIALW